MGIILPLDSDITDLFHINVRLIVLTPIAWNCAKSIAFTAFEGGAAPVSPAERWTIFTLWFSTIPNLLVTIRLATEAKAPRIALDQSFPIARTDAKGSTNVAPAVCLFACVNAVKRIISLPGASCLACWVVLVLFPADSARSQSLRDLIGSVGAPRASVNTPPLPSVARIIVPERNGTSFGSGSLVFAERDYALVVTNWHVVSDRVGEVSVQFPDGFQSAGKVLKVDRDWDLAAIGIWRPQVEPMRLAAQAPQIGDALAIAGYGSGQWRLAPGRCTQFVSPGSSFPADMIEVSVEARQGDSGGPILNQQGEIAGVLFGAGRGSTSGSHAPRVQSFLESVYPILREAPDTGLATRGAQPGEQASQKPPVIAHAQWEQPAAQPIESNAARAGGLLIEEPKIAQAAGESRAARPLVAAKSTPRRATDDELRDWVTPAKSELEAAAQPQTPENPNIDQKPLRVARIERNQAPARVRTEPASTMVAPGDQADCSKFDPAFPSLSGGTEGEVFSLSSNETIDQGVAPEAAAPAPKEGLFEQGKAFLALLGGVTILLQLVKIFGAKAS